MREVCPGRWQGWPCHWHTPRQPLNNRIHFCSSSEFWVTTVVRGRWKRNKNMKHSDFQYIFSLVFGRKNYTIMSFLWCAHQQEWKPHLSSFGLIENQSLGNSAGLSALLLSSRTAEGRQQEHRANESYWTLMPVLTVEIHRKICAPQHFNPIC